LRKALHH